jgi:hypothetical protein
MKNIFRYASRAQYSKMVKDSTTVIKSVPLPYPGSKHDMY